MPGDSQAAQEYVRAPIPDVRLSTPLGHRTSLRSLPRTGAVLVATLPEPPVMRADLSRRLSAWNGLSPHLSVVPLLRGAPRTPPVGLPSSTLFVEDFASLHQAFSDSQPGLLLLGTDGLLAGGPVSGPLPVLDAFLDDVAAALDAPAPRATPVPLAISCKCITYGRVEFLEESLASFLAQDYDGESELVIVNDYPLQRLHFDHPRVRIFNLDFTFPTIGAKENFAVSACRFDTIAVWDDDDIALAGHLDNVNRFFPGHDLLHWERGAFLEGDTIRALRPLGNSGIVYSRPLWEAVGGHPFENAGYDVTFVNRLLAAGGSVAKAQPDPRDVSWFYLWGNGSYHMSGLGTDDGTRPDVITRHSAHVEALRAQGRIPLGDVELRPRWKRPYADLLEAYLIAPS